MKTPTRTCWLCLVAFAALAAFAMQPAHNFSDKTVGELLSLLESTNSSVRACAAVFLGDRYRNPRAVVLNGPIRKPNSPAPELPIPSRVIPALTAHLKSDADWAVRVSAMGSLACLRFRTNTTPIVALALEDKDTLIRIRTCSVLIDISHDYSEPLQAKTIPTLIACLNPQGDIEVTWQAAFAAEQLGTNGIPVVPALRTLMTEGAPKVRRYAERALSAIESATNSRP